MWVLQSVNINSLTVGWLICGGLLLSGFFTPVVPEARAQLKYEGAIAPTQYHYTQPRFSFSQGGLTYSRNCFGRTDPSPADNFPGCLGMTGHPHFAPVQFGAFSVEPPRRVPESQQTERGFPASMPIGTEVIPMMDPSVNARGNSIFSELANAAQNWTNREIRGVEILPDGTLLHTCAHDWYNAGNVEFPSHCLSRSTNPNVTRATGPFDIVCVPPYEALCHTQQTAAYVGVIGNQGFADHVFARAGFSARGEPICLTGMVRAPGSKEKWSQGTSLYAFRCSDMQRRGTEKVEAVPLINHAPADSFSRRHNVNAVKWPKYSSRYSWSPSSSCEDIAWGEYPVPDGNGGSRLRSGLFVACRFGGPVWWYGTDTPWQDPYANRYVLDGQGGACLFNAGSPQSRGGEDCSAAFNSTGAVIPRDFVNPCNINKGYHGVFADAPHYRAVVLFYRSSDLAASARASLRGARGNHLSDVPFEVVIDTPTTMWDRDCAGFAGIAYDEIDKRLFVVEKNGGNSLIHTYSVTATETPQTPDTSSCGEPSYDARTDGGVYVWQNCPGGIPSGQWSIRFASGSPQVARYQGQLTSTAGFQAQTGVRLEANDRLTNNNNNAEFRFRVLRAGVDGIDLNVSSSGRLCLEFDVRNGSSRVVRGANGDVGRSPVNLVDGSRCR